MLSRFAMVSMVLLVNCPNFSRADTGLAQRIDALVKAKAKGDSSDGGYVFIR